MSERLRCAKCSAETARAEIVPLWDGKTYCRACAEAACPGLSEFARNNKRLSETLTFSWPAVMLGVLWMYLIGIFFLMILFTPGALGDKHPAQSLLAYLVISAFVAFCPVAVMTCLQPWMVRRALPTVTVEKGRVRVTRQRKKDNECEFALADCRWKVGSLRGDTELGRSLIAPKKAIVISFPEPALGSFFKYKVACGFTPETRRMWEGFLKLAGVPTK